MQKNSQIFSEKMLRCFKRKLTPKVLYFHSKSLKFSPDPFYIALFDFSLLLGYNNPNRQKGYFMHTISATEIKQNSTRLQEALRDDILITKRDKPFVVVMDYEKYIKINNSDKEWVFWSDNEIDNFGKIAIGLSNHNYDDSDEDYTLW